MKDRITFKLFGICGLCKKDRFFLRRAEITLPNTGTKAFLRAEHPGSLLCKKCRRVVEEKITSGYNNQ